MCTLSKMHLLRGKGKKLKSIAVAFPFNWFKKEKPN